MDKVQELERQIAALRLKQRKFERLPNGTLTIGWRELEEQIIELNVAARLETGRQREAV